MVGLSYHELLMPMISQPSVWTRAITQTVISMQAIVRLRLPLWNVFPKKKSLGNHSSTVGPPGGRSDELVGPTCSSARFINYWCFNCNWCFLWLELIAEWNYWGSEENCVHVEWGWSAIWGDCGYDHAIAIWCVFLFQNTLLVFYFACLVFC